MLFDDHGLGPGPVICTLDTARFPMSRIGNGVVSHITLCLHCMTQFQIRHVRKTEPNPLLHRFRWFCFLFRRYLLVLPRAQLALLGSCWFEGSTESHWHIQQIHKLSHGTASLMAMWQQRRRRWPLIRITVNPSPSHLTEHDTR